MQDALAANITQEQGKTLADAKGDVFRGLGMQLMPCSALPACLLVMAALIGNVVLQRWWSTAATWLLT